MSNPAPTPSAPDLDRELVDSFMDSVESFVKAEYTKQESARFKERVMLAIRSTLIAALRARPSPQQSWFGEMREHPERIWSYGGFVHETDPKEKTPSITDACEYIRADARPSLDAGAAPSDVLIHSLVKSAYMEGARDFYTGVPANKERDIEEWFLNSDSCRRSPNPLRGKNASA